jgi:hypothetical protein
MHLLAKAGGMVHLFRVVRKWQRRQQRKSRQEPRPIATFVSYPKSGRTWLRVILDELGMTLKYTHDGAGASKRRTFLEGNHCQTHRYRELPVVFMARDPRDTVVSAFFHQKFRMADCDESMAQFIQDPHRGIEKIVLYNLAWLEGGRRLRAFLPITYEEMSADGLAVVRRVTKFLGRDIPDVKLERVLANNTFEKMHQREAKGEYRQTYDWELSPGDPNNPESFKTRRGKVRGFREYLSVEDVAYCDHVLGRHAYFERAAGLAGPVLAAQICRWNGR